MAQAARFGDLFVGICYDHDPPIQVSGVIIQGSSNTLTNSLQQARLGDVVLGFCGHTALIVSASGNVLVNGIGAARLGDSIAGGSIVGTIVQGSSNMLVNG